MSAASTDGNNVFPITGVTLTFFVIASGKYGSVCFQPHSIAAASTHSNDVCPVVDFKLAFFIMLDNNNRAVGSQTHSVI